MSEWWAPNSAKLDEQITSLRDGGTLTESEVKELCEMAKQILHQEKNVAEVRELSTLGENVVGDDLR